MVTYLRPASWAITAYAPRVLDATQRMLSWRMAHAEQALTHLQLGPGGVFERRDARRR